MDKSRGFSPHPVNSFSRPQNLKEILVQKGFKKLGSFPTMIYDLDQLPNEKTKDPLLESQEFEFRLASKEDEFRSFAFLRFPEKTESDQKSIESMVEFLKSENPSLTEHYVVFDSSKKIAVAAGTLYFRDDWAGICQIYTSPEWRKRGLGSALVRFFLERAKQNGKSYVLLTSSPMGVSIYQKIGFKIDSDLELFQK